MIVIGPFVAIVVIAALWKAIILLLLIVVPFCHHDTEFRDGLGSLAVKVSQDEAVE